MTVLGMFPDVWALVVVLVAFVVTGVLAVWQVRGRAVWLWAWFVPGVLVLVYGLIALLLKLTEFGNYLGIGYVDDVTMIRWLRKEFPWAAGVSGLLFALSAVIVSLRGRVGSWRAARMVGGVALVGALVIGGVLGWRLFLLNELSLEESRVLLYESRVGLWAVIFLVVLGGCIRGAAGGAAGGVSRERAVLLGGLSVSAGAMIVQACVVPAAYRYLFLLHAHSRVPSSENMGLAGALQNNLSEGVWPEVLLAFVCIAVCVALMLRKSASHVAWPARRDVVVLLVFCVLVTGLMSAVVLKTGEVKELYVGEIQRELLGPLPHSSDKHIVPWSTTDFGNEDSALGIIVGRESLEVMAYDGIRRPSAEKPAAAVAFSRGEAFPDAFGERIRAAIEERKKAVAIFNGSYEPRVVVAADQLTDYQTFYALIAYVTGDEFELSQLRLLVRRFSDSRRAIKDGTIFLTRSYDADEENEAYPRVHISSRGFDVRFQGVPLAAIDGCPPEGPTVCAAVPADRLHAMLEEARALFLQQQTEPAQKLADAYMNSFGFRNLYNQMARLKKDSPDKPWLIVSADADVPYHVVIKVLDTLRYLLEHDYYETDEAFESAEIRKTNHGYVRLFGEPQLAPPGSSGL